VSAIDWDHRILCPDGGCNGVVGDDGTCKVCGTAVPNWGEERLRGLQSEPQDDEDDEDDDDLEDDEEYEDADEETVGEETEGEEPQAEWTDRKLCDDGACVGVIGPNGTCTVCGKQSAA
jgi:hypothetical protein